MNKYFNKLLAIYVFFILPCTNLFAQKTESPFLKNRYNISLGYTRSEEWVNVKANRFIIEGNYGFYNFLDAGLFVDGCMYKRNWDYWAPTGPVSTDTTKNYVLRYGLTSKIHVLHFFVNPAYRVLDFYISPKIGLMSGIINCPEIPEPFYQKNYTKFFYSFGAGIGVNFCRYFGLYLEYNYERDIESIIKLGLNVRI